MATSSSVSDRVKDLFSSFISNFDRNADSTSEKESRSNSQCKSPAPVPAVSKCTNAARNKMLYYDRVETYSDLSPLVCARYGWTNVEADMLQCVHCKAFLCGQLPKAVDTEGYRESCHKLKKSLTDSHEKLCTWPSNPCPELFSRVPYHHQEELMGDFRHRLISLQCTSAKLPSLAYTALLDQNLTMDKMQISVEEILKRAALPDLENVQTDVVLFAVCGWAYGEGQIDILQCSYCRRKVGLWNYNMTRSKDTSMTEKSSPSEAGNTVQSDSEGTETRQDTDDDDAEPKRKRTKIEKQSFDLISEHRYWCPWIQLVRGQRTKTTTPHCSPARQATPSPQTTTTPDSSPFKLMMPDTPPSKSPGSTYNTVGEWSMVPAWLLAMRMLSHEGDDMAEDFCSQMKQSPQVEGLRHLRKVLRECTSQTSPVKPTSPVQSS